MVEKCFPPNAVAEWRKAVIRNYEKQAKKAVDRALKEVPVGGSMLRFVVIDVDERRV
jgi:hypothetical protein